MFHTNGLHRAIDFWEDLTVAFVFTIWSIDAIYEKYLLIKKRLSKKRKPRKLK